MGREAIRGPDMRNLSKSLKRPSYKSSNSSNIWYFNSNLQLVWFPSPKKMTVTI